MTTLRHYDPYRISSNTVLLIRKGVPLTFFSFLFLFSGGGEVEPFGPIFFVNL